MTTITKRVTAVASGGQTKRITAAAVAANTVRVAAVASSGQTKRVLSSGAIAVTGPFIGTDTWSRSWGGAMTSLSSWGRTWFYGTPATDAVAASPGVNVTGRVGAIPAGGQTKRVTL